jgi:hypothetical protein
MSVHRLRRRPKNPLERALFRDIPNDVGTRTALLAGLFAPVIASRPRGRGATVRFSVLLRRGLIIDLVDGQELARRRGWRSFSSLLNVRQLAAVGRGGRRGRVVRFRGAR